MKTSHNHGRSQKLL